MTGIDILYAVFSLLFVLGLIGGLALLMRHSSGLKNTMGRLAGGRTTSRDRRLCLVESLAVDTRRRLVLVRADDREHLLLVGGDRDLVVHSQAPIATEPRAHDRSR